MTVALTTGPGVSAALDTVIDRRVDLRAVALLRVLMGAVVIRHLWPDVRASVTPVQRFHVPWWSWLPEPSPATFRLLLWVGVAAGLAMVLGLATRLATATACAIVAYLLFVDMTGFAHNRGYLVWLLFGLALLPTGGAFSIARRAGWRRRSAPVDGTGPWWPLLMLRIVVSSVYLTSGVTKLLNPDWHSGLVLWDRMTRNEHLIPFEGVVHDLLTSRAFHHLLSPGAIAVEVFVGIGLWFGRTRLVAIWVALVFHLSIELTASVQTFSYSAIAALLLWVTPAARDRMFAGTARQRAIVRRLDWLGRFTLAPQPVARGEPAMLVDRDGTVRRGRDAALTAFSRLSLLFPVVAPVLAARRVRGSGERGVGP